MTRGSGKRRAALGLITVLVLGVGVFAQGSSGSSTRRVESLTAPHAVSKSAKLDSRLLARARARQPVRVEISARRPAAARALVARLGGRVEASYGRLIEAVVPPAALQVLGQSRAVQYAREPIRAVPEAVRGEGVAATGALTWHRSGLRGAGAKVAVIDLGFRGWRDSRRNGDLPASTVAVDFCSGGLDGPIAVNHGTAVAEIVAEMAPAASLYLICAQTRRRARSGKGLRARSGHPHRQPLGQLVQRGPRRRHRAGWTPRPASSPTRAPRASSG